MSSRTSRMLKLMEQAERIKCPDLGGFVPGVGPCDARVVVIGEAPGATEEKRGVPFCGASGRFLTELLESVGLSREDVYITNTVKRRPPQNADPTPTEVDRYKGILRNEIQLISPRVIVPVGRFSTSLFTERKISEVAGTMLMARNGTPVCPQYHPAVALYNGSMRERLFADFAMVKEWL